MLRIIKLVLKILPVVGSIVKNIDSKDGEKGKIEWGRLGQDVIEIGGIIALEKLIF